MRPRISGLDPLPCAPSSPRVARATRATRILIVDDEPDTVATLLALVRDQGHEAAGFGSGKAALACMDMLDPDVVICDIVMRVPNGWDIAREVRRREPPRPLLIAISGRYTKSSSRFFAHVLGFDCFLPKPCDPELLLGLIGQARP